MPILNVKNTFISGYKISQKTLHSYLIAKPLQPAFNNPL